MTANAQFQPSGGEVKAAAFHEHRRSGGMTQSRWRVLREFARGGSGTRNEIAERAELPLSSVCGRCKELGDMGYLDVVGTVRVEGGASRQRLELTAEGLDAMAQQMQDWTKQEHADG